MDTVYKNSDGTCCRLTTDASNFDAWKGQVTALLTMADCLDIALGTDLRPSIPTGIVTAAVIVDSVITVPASTAQVDPEVLAENKRDVQAWDVRMRKAIGILYGSVSGPIQPTIQKHLLVRDPVAMWNTLTNQFDAINNQGISFSIKEKFFKDCLAENERIDEYITRLLGYQSQLAFTDSPLADQIICDRLLSGLTAIWKPHVHAIRLAKQTGNLTHICTELRSFGTFTQGTDVPATAAAATTSSGRGGRGKGRGRGRGRGSTRGRGASTSSSTTSTAAPRPSGVTKGYTVKCWLCNETGHKIPDCPQKKRFDEFNLANGAKRDSGGSGSGSHGTAA